MKAKVAAGVAALWVLVAAVSGTQATLGASLQGDPVAFWPQFRSGLINYLPWIPATLVVIALAARFPVTRASWKRSLPIHLVAIPLVAFLANVLVVVGFWIQAGRFQGFGALVRGGIFWATLRIHVVVMLYVAIAGITQGVAYYRAARARELHFARLESQLARARLEALSAQIRPHFLFNTLHTIGQLWRTGRSEEADGLLDHLGSLFQRVQSTSALAEVPLEEELDMVGEYLAIEEARFRDRLRVDIEATPEARRAPVPPLILQPLVENAIRHGISTTSTAGRVDVRARVEGGTLELLVEDDGPGADGAPAPGGSGTGLRNTRERLAQLYGTAASIETSSPPGGGFRVRVRLPASGAARP